MNLLRQRGRRRRGKGKLNWQKRLIYYLPVAFFFGAVCLFLFAIVSFAWIAKDLPSPDKIVRHEGFATRIYDRQNKLLYDVFKEAKRTPVELGEIPNTLKWATIAIEDKEFYSHPGFSIRGIARAAFNIVFRRRLQGGSTLTQQLVKNVLLTPKRTLSRKYKELILTLQIERKYNKDEILLMYLNEAPYGGTAWGVGSASEQYFGKSVSKLNLVESAILAGLPQRPTVYSPFSGDDWQNRTKAVLRRMREDGYISRDEEEEVTSEIDEVEFNQERGLMKAPHFVMHVKKILAEKYGEEVVELGGLRVTTTLDLDLQEKAEKIIEEELKRVETLSISNGAAVVLDPETGQVLAMVGSKDYFSEDIDGKFNVITQGLRQPGSAIKPITYVTAFKKGYTSASLLMDTRTVFPIIGQKDYVPINYDGKYHGSMQVRFALGNSINVPAVKTLAMVGLREMLAVADEMGISTLAPTKGNLSRLGFSVTLGGGDVKPIELASAYLAFANGGIKRESVAILKVEDRDGNVLLENKNFSGHQVLSKGEAFLISDILSDNEARLITFGEHSGLVISGRKVAVKTGTTNDKRDNWAVGWMPKALTLAWVGNNDNSPMMKVASGISGATPIWRRVMTAAIDRVGYQSFEVPDGIVSAEIDKVSGFRSHDNFPSRNEYFIKGTEPSGDDPVHLKLKVCPQSGKLATPPQIARGEYEEKEFIVFKEEDPVSTDGKNRWQEGILAWISEHDSEHYHPPTEYCEEGGLIEVAIDSPANESTVKNGFPVKIKAKGVKKIVEVTVYVDGKKKKKFTSKPYEFDLTLPDGPYTIKVVAKDENGDTGEREAEIGVNVPWDWEPSPTPTPTLAATPTLTPASTLTPAPTTNLTPTEIPIATPT